MKSVNKRIYAIIAVVVICLLGGSTKPIGMNRARMRS